MQLHPVHGLEDQNHVAGFGKRRVCRARAAHVHNALLRSHQTAGGQHRSAFEHQGLALAHGVHVADPAGKHLARAFQLAARLHGILAGQDAHALAGMDQLGLHIPEGRVFQQQADQLLLVDGEHMIPRAGARAPFQLADCNLMQFQVHDKLLGSDVFGRAARMNP